MKTVTITRLEANAEGTFGVILVDHMIQGFTLELPWKMNQQNISCIPAGQYNLFLHNSPKFGWTYEVSNVYGRSNILFHPANIVEQLRGCIAVGETIRKMKIHGNEHRAVANSGKTFRKFMAIMDNQQESLLTIREEY